MNKICTDIKQSQKLIELGIDINTADMYYCYGMDIHTKKWDYDIVPTIIDAFNQIDISDIPAWSLSALLKLMPKSTISTPNPFCDIYCCRNIEFDMEFYDNNPVDAAFAMVCWLKENGKI